MHSQNGAAAPPIAGHTANATGSETRATGKKTGREDACYEGTKTGLKTARGGRARRSGRPPAADRNAPGRAGSRAEESDSHTRRRPTNSRPHGNATGLPVLRRKKTGLGDPSYGGRNGRETRATGGG